MAAAEGLQVPAMGGSAGGEGRWGSTREMRGTSGWPRLGLGAAGGGGAAEQGLSGGGGLA